MSATPVVPLAALAPTHAPLLAPGRAVVSVLLLVFGFFLLRGAVTTLRTAWLVRDTPTETVRSIAAGRTEATGEAVPAGEPFPQPFVEGEAVLASYEIQRYDDSASDSKASGWTTTERGELMAPFLLDDGTGRVEVAATEDTDLYVSDENTTRVTVGRHEPEPRPVREFLAAHTDRDVDADADGSAYSQKHRYVQEVVPPGEVVYVFGQARPSEESDEPDDGPATDGEDAASGVPGSERLVIERDDATGRFVVSDMEEGALRSGLRRRLPVLLGLGLVLSLIGFRLALIELGLG